MPGEEIDPAPTPAMMTMPRSRKAVAAAGVAGIVVLLLLAWWVAYRFNHSITNDAFIESDMVELAPRVAGQIVEMRVADNEAVVRGQVLARIDPQPYQRKLAQAGAALKVAEAEHAVATATLQKVQQQVPQQIVAAEQQLAVARSLGTVATQTVAQTRATVEHDVRLAEQGVNVSQASLTFARTTAERWNALLADRAVTPEERDAKQAAFATATAQHAQAQTRLAQAHSDGARLLAAEAALRAEQQRSLGAQAQLAIARQGPLAVAEAKGQLDAAAQRVESARAALAEAQLQLDHTALVAPFDGVVAKRFKFQGDYGAAGVPAFSLYDTGNLFVTAHIEETQLADIAAGQAVEVTVDAIDKPFEGRVLWVGKATGAQFALIPRDLSTGQFTKVIQRVPVRIAIEKDERWPQLRPGLSASVAISHSTPAASAAAKAN